VYTAVTNLTDRKLLRLPEGPLYTTINILAIGLPSYFTSSVSSYFEEGFRENPNEPHHTQAYGLLLVQFLLYGLAQ